jgi:hypothetical protein
MVLSVFWLVLNIQTNEFPQQRWFCQGIRQVLVSRFIKTIVRFYFGSQDDVRYEAKNGWLTNYPDFNQNFSGDK